MRRPSKMPQYDPVASMTYVPALPQMRLAGDALGFVSLSGLLSPNRSARLRSQHRADLKSRLREVLGAKAVNEYQATELRSAVEHYGDLTLLQVLYQIKKNLRQLVAEGVRVLVLDMTFEAGPRERSLVVALLSDIWCCGMDILIPLDDGASISFDKMAEVVNGNDFLALYVKQLWR